MRRLVTTEIQNSHVLYQLTRDRAMHSSGLAITLRVVLLLWMPACMQIFDTPLPVLVEVADFAVDEAGLRAYEASLPQHLESAHEGEARIRDVLGGLVDRQIMVMEARRLGYFEAAEVQRRLQGGAVEWLTKRLIDSVTGDSAGVNTPDEEQAYRNGWNRRVRLAHIELADEATAIEASEALAAGADFAEVARSRSRAPDAADGGDLARYFGFGDLPEALAAGVGNIEVGEVSDIIPTGRGFEIVRVLAGAAAPQPAPASRPGCAGPVAYRVGEPIRARVSWRCHRACAGACLTRQCQPGVFPIRPASGGSRKRSGVVAGRRRHPASPGRCSGP